MAKANREARRKRQRTRGFDTSAAELADRADTAAERLVNGTHLSLLAAGRPIVKIDLDRVPKVRANDLKSGAQWPPWCWYPSAFLAMSLTANPDDAFLGALESGKLSAYPLATVVAWQQGRIAARFDPDLLDAIVETPITGDLPGDILRRLPAWAFYIDCPHLGPGTGVFVSLDAFPQRGPGGFIAPVPTDQQIDELLITFVRPDSDVLVTANLALDQGNLAETLQASQPQPFWAQVADFLDRPAGPALQSILAMLLYLASTDGDLANRNVPSERRPGAQPGLGQGAPVDVMTAGYRVGAALRLAHSGERHDTAAAPTGRTTAPHLRRAHWHSYWVGPLDQPEVRHLELRWISPILVSAERDDTLVTVVRSVPKPPADG
jgi:hypothetical protein